MTRAKIQHQALPLAALLLAAFSGCGDAVSSTRAADLRGETNNALYPVDQNGKWGFINDQGQLVIKPAFDKVTYFSEGMATVEIGGKQGYVDEAGRIVIEPRFGYGFAFNEGLAWVEGTATAGFIDKTGKVVVFSPSDTYCRRFRDGLARTMPIPPRPMPQLIRDARRETAPLPSLLDGSEFDPAPRRPVGFIDKSGDYAFPSKFDAAWDFREQLAAVEIDNKWGFIDRTGAVVIEPKFDGVSSFSSGRASIVMNKKYGYIDRKGNVIVEPKYDYGHSYLGELAGVTFHPKRGDGAGTGYVNRAGRIVWAPEPKAKD